MTTTIVTSKFGNRLRALAEDVDLETDTSIGSDIAIRLRELATEIDADHADTLERVNAIHLALERI